MKQIVAIFFLFIAFNAGAQLQKGESKLDNNTNKGRKQTAMAGETWSPDNGDGTFKNPLLWGDWADPDVIRVEDEFYFVSTSMHYVPGCPVLKSKDLINWEMAGYAVDKYDEDPRYNLQGGSMYSNGSWAATIRHHNGLFYVGFCTPSRNGAKGSYLCVLQKISKGPGRGRFFLN